MTILVILQIFISIILIFFILIQSKGTGLGRTFGSSFSTSFTRRGLEKIIFKLTFILTLLFFIFSILVIVQ